MIITHELQPISKTIFENFNISKVVHVEYRDFSVPFILIEAGTEYEELLIVNGDLVYDSVSKFYEATKLPDEKQASDFELLCLALAFNTDDIIVDIYEAEDGETIVITDIDYDDSTGDPTDITITVRRK